MTSCFVRLVEFASTRSAARSGRGVAAARAPELAQTGFDGGAVAAAAVRQIVELAAAGREIERGEFRLDREDAVRAEAQAVEFQAQQHGQRLGLFREFAAQADRSA